MDSHAKYRHYRETFVDDPARKENDWRYSYNAAQADSGCSGDDARVTHELAAAEDDVHRRSSGPDCITIRRRAII